MIANIKTSERVVRSVFSIIIPIAVLLSPDLPPWLALVAIYPFFTALTEWDPFYAAFNALRRLPTNAIQHHVSPGLSG